VRDFALEHTCANEAGIEQNEERKSRDRVSGAIEFSFENSTTLSRDRDGIPDEKLRKKKVLFLYK